MRDHRVVLHRCVVREWCHPSGSAGATCLHAAARTRRAAHAVQGDVVSVWQVLHGTPSAPPIPAQRVARFDDHCTRNCLLKNQLRQRYSRYIDGNTLKNTARYINHSCDPNCEIQTTSRAIWIVALRDIPEGEELTYRYDYEYEPDGYRDFPCYCGAQNCVGSIVDARYWELITQ